MQLTLFLVGLVVAAADPILWIAPIIAAFFSKGRWWVVPLAALIWGGVLEFVVRPQLMPSYAGEHMGLHLSSALLNGFVVLGIASLIRKMRGPDRYPSARQPSPPPPVPGQNWNE
jgi:hypothetical protein